MKLHITSPSITIIYATIFKHMLLLLLLKQPIVGECLPPHL